MLKFQVTTAAASSAGGAGRCPSPARQRISRRCPSPSPPARVSDEAQQHSVDRSIDELEEYFVQQMTAPPHPTGTGGRVRCSLCDSDECLSALNVVPFCRRFPSPCPSLPDLSVPSSSSSASSSSSSLNGTLGRRKSPAALAQKQKRMVGEWGYLRVYTGQIKTDTDYKTLRVPFEVNTECVIGQLVLEKLRLSIRDLNLFHLFMEVRTRRMDGTEARSILKLDRVALPLELQKCHPEGMSRFILGMDSNAILARIYDGEVNPVVGTFRERRQWVKKVDKCASNKPQYVLMK